MSRLRIYSESGELLEDISSPEEIAKKLEEIGVLFERWAANKPLRENPSDEEIIEAYKHEIDKLIDKYGFQSYDVIA